MSLSTDTSSAASPFRLTQENKPIVIASLFILVILAVGTIYTLSTQGTATLLSPTYLLQQLQVGAFLGIVAAGMVACRLCRVDIRVILNQTIDTGNASDRQIRPEFVRPRRVGNPQRQTQSHSQEHSDRHRQAEVRRHNGKQRPAANGHRVSISDRLPPKPARAVASLTARGHIQRIYGQSR